MLKETGFLTSIHNYTEIAKQLTDAANFLEQGQQDSYQTALNKIHEAQNGSLQWENRVCQLIDEKSCGIVYKALRVLYESIGGNLSNLNYGKEALWGKTNIYKEIIIDALRTCADEVPVQVHTWEILGFDRKSHLVHLFQSSSELRCQVYDEVGLLAKEHLIPLGGRDPAVVANDLKKYEVGFGNVHDKEHIVRGKHRSEIYKKLDHLHVRTLHFYQNGNKEYSYGYWNEVKIPVTIPEEIHFFPQPRAPIYSQYDSERKQALNLNTCAVTIANTGEENLNPKTWGGHAVLIYEGVKQGRYFQHMAHLNKQKGIELYDSDNFSIPFARGQNSGVVVKGQSPTQYVTLDAVMQLITEIMRDITEQKIKFHLQGRSSITAYARYIWQAFDREQGEPISGDHYDNCITWIIAKLESIGLLFRTCKKGWLISTPKDFVS